MRTILYALSARANNVHRVCMVLACTHVDHVHECCHGAQVCAVFPLVAMCTCVHGGCIVCGVDKVLSCWYTVIARTSFGVLFVLGEG